ncbi:hypothetical protein BGZ83_000009 [Gryganskiella cystojenkinii]|nr:hypothetical protein BGZ83_000009 [Gryganskiella cystojenkinii]
MSVSQDWRQTFDPILWSRLTFTDSSTTRRHASASALASHAHLVHSLSFQGRFPDEYFTIRGLKNLRSFHYSGSTIVPQRLSLIARFIQAHRESLESIDVYLHGNKPVAIFWEALSECVRLESLVLHFAEIRLKRDFDQFWASLQNLVSLSLTDVVMTDGCLDRLDTTCSSSSSAFPLLINLKHIHLSRLRGATSEKQMLLLQQCPNLLSIFWRGIEFIIKFSMRTFVHALQAGTWPHLHSIDVIGDEVQDELLSTMLQSMIKPGPRSLTLIKTGFGPQAFATIERISLGTTIQKLELHACVRVPSWILQRIMETMSSLRYFSADRLSESDITSGSNWACQGLEHLEILIDLDYDPSSVDSSSPSQQQQQQAVTYTSPSLEARHRSLYGQIARLDRLKFLNVTRYVTGLVNSSSVNKMRHCLCHGLGSLETLRRLQHFRFAPGFQELGEDEILWMTIHWPRLETVSAGVTRDFDATLLMVAKLNRHGIKTV